MTYTAGDVISFDVDITAHHMGRLSFAICPDADVTEACFAAHPLIRSVSNLENLSFDVMSHAVLHGQNI